MSSWMLPMYGPDECNKNYNYNSGTLSSYELPYSMRNQTVHPYKLTANIIVLYILIFIFLRSKQEDKMLCIPELNLLIVSSCMHFDLLELFQSM
jgi:hypothetical protein